MWRRAKGGNTTDQVYFVVALLPGKEDTFNDVLERKLKFFCSVNNMWNGSESTGYAALKYVTSLSQSSSSGLGGFCLKTFGDGNEMKAATVVATKIDNYYSH